MAGKSDVNYGNVAVTHLMQITASGTSAAANTTTASTFTVPGVLPGDQVSAVTKATLQAGLFIAASAVTAANTISVVFGNLTASPIVPTANDTYLFEINRYSAIGTPLPNAFV